MPGLARSAGKGGETLAERAQMIGQLPLVVALVDVSIPTPKPDCRNPDARLAADQRREPGCLSGEAGWRRRAVISDLPLFVQCADQLCACRPPFAIGFGERVIAGIEPIERAADFGLVDRQRLG